MTTLESETVLRDAAGPNGWSDDPEIIKPRLTDWRGRRHGDARLLLRPATVDAIQAIVRVAAQHRIALVPQGGRTGLVGGGLPEPGRPSVLLSLERLNRIRSVDAEGMMLVAEAGVALQTIHEAAAAVHCRFPLSLAAKGSATIGGLVSTNAGGTQVLRHGTMRARVLGLEAVMADGSLLAGLSGLRKDNTGYDIKQLLIGAEGTLGIVTAAALALAPIPPERAVAWAGVTSPAAALQLLTALRGAIGEQVESFELMPGDAAALVAMHIGGRDPLPGHPWVVLIEVAGVGVAPGLEAALAHCADKAVIAANDTQAAALWAIREWLPEAERRDGPAAKHDIALPVAAVPAFMAEVTPALEARFAGASVLAFGHLGDGNLHYNVRIPAGAGADWLAANGPEITAHIHEAVVARGGSISAEHGIGSIKREDLARFGNPVKLVAMRAVKRALDPFNIMNPGKLFA